LDRVALHRVTHRRREGVTDGEQRRDGRFATPVMLSAVLRLDSRAALEPTLPPRLGRLDVRPTETPATPRDARTAPGQRAPA